MKQISIFKLLFYSVVIGTLSGLLVPSPYCYLFTIGIGFFVGVLGLVDKNENIQDKK